MAAKVKVEFTRVQAEALLRAADHCLAHADVTADVFTPARLRAAGRAFDLLAAAVRDAAGGGDGWT